jgi:hypothetical protein
MIEYDTKQMKHRTPGDINYGMTGWARAVGWIVMIGLCLLFWWGIVKFVF